MWQTAQADAATMLVFARLSKAYFVLAMMHALMVRNFIMTDAGKLERRWKCATGVEPPIELLRVFGADMYGFVTVEQRRALRYDKADPRTVFGKCVGFDATKFTWLNATAAKIWSQGVAVIDEQKLISAAPKATQDDLSSMVRAATDGLTVYEAASGRV